jgi:Phytanoyl-CoA dioxygenase (PhyH)
MTANCAGACQPSAEQIESFRSDGFLRLGQVILDQELSFVRDCCDRVLDEWRSRSSRFVSLAGDIPESLVTVVSPEAIAPELKDTQFAQNAKLAAARLYDCEPEDLLMGWRLFLKPPGGHGTPWHQDAAYRPPPFVGSSMFVPLDSISETSCIRYIAGSNTAGLTPHVFEHGHFIAEPSVNAAPVPCPLEPGEACIHHCLTLHATGPNDTPQARRAFAIVFQPQSRKHTETT